MERELAIDGEFGVVGGVAVDGRGRIYVADAQRQELLAFGADGEPLGTLGRRGRGPGEFQQLRDVAVGRGDTVLALDPGQQRVSVFGPDGKRAFDLRLPALGRAGQPLLALASGGLILPYHPKTAGRAATDAPLSLVSVPRGARGDAAAVGSVPGRPRLRAPLGQGRWEGEMPYAATPVLRVGPGDRVYQGSGDSASIAVLDAAGRRVGAIRWEWTPAPVTRGDVRRLLASLGGEASTRVQRHAIEAAQRDGTLPAHRPAFAGFVVDDAGRVWVRPVRADEYLVRRDRRMEYVRDGAGAEAAEWWVFDGDGRRVGTATLPRRVRLSAVRADRAYGVETDEDGVQRVVRFRVTAPGPAAQNPGSVAAR
ncbi:MAG TPA: 6-bladed beta-propeller [Longimicrobium sp.]|nr:6-bladed beta-propeller [Longimicrobium sp.]